METDKTIKCIKEIENLITQYNFEFPEKIKTGKIKKEIDPLKIIKRISGIITNANETNAEMKLKSLIKFLSAIKK